MATESWAAYAPGAAISYPQSLLSINNGSAYVVKIRRVGFIASYWLTVTGNLVGGTMSRYSGGYIQSDLVVTTLRPYQAVPIEPMPNDSNYSSLPDTIEVLSGGKAYGATESIFRRFILSVDEASNYISTIDENTTTEVLNTWITSEDTNVQPIILNSGEMFVVQVKEASSTSQVGIIDIWIEFDLER